MPSGVQLQNPNNIQAHNIMLLKNKSQHTHTTKYTNRQYQLRVEPPKPTPPGTGTGHWLSSPTKKLASQSSTEGFIQTASINFDTNTKQRFIPKHNFNPQSSVSLSNKIYTSSPCFSICTFFYLQSL